MVDAHFMCAPTSTLGKQPLFVVPVAADVRRLV
jgi:hypothetical protein